MAIFNSFLLVYQRVAATSLGGLPICVWNAAPGCWPKHDRSSSGVVVCRGLRQMGFCVALQNVNLKLSGMFGTWSNEPCKVYVRYIKLRYLKISEDHFSNSGPRIAPLWPEACVGITFPAGDTVERIYSSILKNSRSLSSPSCFFGTWWRSN